MKLIFFILAIFTLLVSPQLASGSDTDDLKAANEKLLRAYKSLDAETAASLIYPGSVSYGYKTVFQSAAPMENNKSGIIQGMKRDFSRLEYFLVVPYNAQYRVIENTGIVWGHTTTYIKPKGQPLITEHARQTTTWIKKDDRWYVIMNHRSAIPPGN